MYYQNPMIISKGNVLRRSNVKTNLETEKENKKALVSHLEILD